MRSYKFIIALFVLFYQNTFSQTTFTNLDTLLVKNFEAVNKRDSAMYLSLINKTMALEGKKLKSVNDSVVAMQAFTDAFRDLIENFADMATDPDATVTYDGYEFRNKPVLENVKGKLMFHVKLIVNNSFSVKMPFVVYANHGRYSIESPMSVMFLEEK